MSAEESEVAAKVAKPQAEVITMADGRQVEFAGKRKLLKETVLNEDGSLNHVLFDFRNGQSRKVVPHEALIGKYIGHGIEQKIGDETAGTDDVDDMVLDVDALIERLSNGEWATRREGGGNAGTSVLMKALMEFSSRTADQVKEFLKGKTQQEKLALRNSAKIKPIVERIEAAKASKGAPVDTDALLSGLE